MRPIYIWRIGAGDTAPALVTVARYARGHIEASDAAIRAWLESGLARVLDGRAAPTNDEEDARVHGELCALRSGTIFLCTVEPLGLELEA